MVKIIDDTNILKIISRKKIITIDTLSSLLSSSQKTARRRLKLWEAYTSYNENGRYYTLPNIPNFDINGLWAYQNVRFSKYGNLKQTIIHFVRHSKAGLDAAEMGDMLGVPIRSFLTTLQNHPDIKREKIQGRFVYFSSVKNDYIKQKDCRIGIIKIKQLPSDMEAVFILVESIKNPHHSTIELSSILRNKNCFVTPDSIQALFFFY